MRLRLAAVLSVALAAALPSRAQHLPGIVRPEHYDLSFVVDLERERFDGTETVRVQVSEPTTRVVLNALDLEVQEVVIGSGAAAQKAAVTIDQAKETATLTVAKAIPNGLTDIHVRFSGVL